MAALNDNAQDPVLRDYVRVVWQRKWIVLAVAVTLTALAIAYSFAKTPLYEASAQLIYENQLNVADPLSSGGGADASQRQTELANVASVIASPELVTSANAILARGSTGSSFTVEVVSDATSGQSDVSTVSIKAISPSADTAAQAANAYAEAFTVYRKAREQARVRSAEQVIQSRIDSFDSATARQTAEYLTLQQRLQDLQILEATVTGNFRILVPATAPNAPFSPKPVRNALMGLVAGLVIGAVIALTVGQFDTRVRSQEEAVALLDMPLWGLIHKIPAKTLDDQPLVVLGESNSSEAEAIRKLRGSLEFADVDGALKSLFITSALQHEGKSVTVCNLAVALAEAGNRVVLVDGDLRRPQVHRCFDLPNAVGVSTVLTGRTDLKDALRSRSVGRRFATVGTVGEVDASSHGHNSVSVLTSGPLPPNPAQIIASTSFAALVAELEAEFDTVIIDAPALLAVGDTAAIARCVDGLVFLVDLTRARRPLLLEAAAQISQMPCRKLGVVVIGKAASHRYGHDHYAYHSHVEPTVSTAPREMARRKDAKV